MKFFFIIIRSIGTCFQVKKIESANSYSFLLDCSKIYPLPLLLSFFTYYSGNLKNRSLIIQISINRILQDDSFFFLFGFVRIGLIFRSISDLILLIQNRYHPIRHHKSATCISQAASNANHCPRKADQCPNKSRREQLH